MSTASVTDVSRAHELLARYAAVRRFTERLSAPLSPEDQTVQSMPDVSPTKWHRAHTTWFFETFLLGEHVAGYQPVDPDYAYLFNSYYVAVGPRHNRVERGLLSRPGATEIGEYRQAVDRAMGDFLTGELTDQQAWLVELGLNHEQQHQELLLMDIKHVLSCNPTRPAYLELPHPPPPVLASDVWIEHPGGVVEVGHPGEGFHYDNETPAHDVLLRPFALRSTLVRCGEWLSFIDDGGYERPDLWMSDGWGARTTQGWEAPEYWQRAADGDGWEVHTLTGVRPVDPVDPVCHVSWYEADAFARWMGHRLPTEAEWETIALPRVAKRGGVGGIDEATLASGVGLHPAPVGPPDHEQWTGAVWQWTASGYGPYPGFTPAAGAVGEYNGKFMVNQQALRGGACVTPAGHSRPTYRNFFYPASRWPFAGLRLAADR
jgi:ergothioneine biosynthesis protein EgtB